MPSVSDAWNLGLAAHGVSNVAGLTRAVPTCVCAAPRRAASCIVGFNLSSRSGSRFM
jgi:hypothetical protein